MNLLHKAECADSTARSTAACVTDAKDDGAESAAAPLRERQERRQQESQAALCSHLTTISFLQEHKESASVA